jgi:hypothetical protein
MNKRFFLIIPYNPLTDKHKNFFSSLVDTFKPATLISVEEKRFYRHKDEVDRRVESCMSGLNSSGLDSIRLDTQSLIELFYNTYNPKTSVNQSLVDINELRVVK